MNFNNNQMVGEYTTDTTAVKEEHSRSKMKILDKHFSDCRFEKGTDTGNFINYCIFTPCEGGSLVSAFDLHMEPCPISYEELYIEVGDLGKHIAEYDAEDHTLKIHPQFVSYEPALLHEMIHMHESYINDLDDDYYRDVLYWALYKRLRTRIPDLEEIIEKHICLASRSHGLQGKEIFFSQVNDIIFCGGHDVLFLLKSLDLDVAMGYPLGTVLSHGLAAEFCNYSYT